MTGTGKRWPGATGIGVAAILLFAGAMLAKHAPPALGDYAEWTYHGVLLRDVLQGHPDAGYVLKSYPVPNSLTTVGLGLLMLLLPWGIAAKIWLVGGAALGLGGSTALSRASGGQQMWKVLVLLSAVLFGAAFWYGFFNFLLGTYFAMWLCALLLKRKESRWMYGTLLIAAFFSHMIPLGFALLTMVLYIVQQRRWKMLWQALPAAALCVWYFAGRWAHGNIDGMAGMTATVPWGTPLFGLFKVNSFVKIWGLINPAGAWTDSMLLRAIGTPGFMVLLAADIAVASGALWLMVRAGWTSLRARGGQRFLWLAVGIFFLVGLCLPGAAAGISDPGARMMEVAAWCGICTVGIRRRPVQAAAGVCAAALLAANFFMFATVAMKPPEVGEGGGRLPARVREFAHVFYGGRWIYYGALERGTMDMPIYPTAMFVKK